MPRSNLLAMPDARFWAMLLAGFVAAFPPGTGRAASTGASENTKVTLLSEQSSVRPGAPFTVGLRMEMRDGWHTYWKNPGDSGLPLRIEWKLPEGFSAGPIDWPAPERMPTGPEMSYGYAGEVLLPILITPPEKITASSITIGGTFRWLECNEVCLPGSATLDLSLPVGTEVPAASPAAPLFAEARSRMPLDAARLGLAAEAGPRAISISFRLPQGTAPRDPYFFVDQPLIADYAAPQAWEPVRGGYRLTMTPAPNTAGPPARLTGVLVTRDRPRPAAQAAFRVDVAVVPGDPSPAGRAARNESPPFSWYAAALGLAGVGLAFWIRRKASVRREGPPRQGTGGGETGI